MPYWEQKLLWGDEWKVERGKEKGERRKEKGERRKEKGKSGKYKIYRS